MNKSFQLLMPLAGLALCWLSPSPFCQSAVAGPSDKDATTALDAIGVIAQSKSLVAEAYAMAIDSEQELAKLYDPKNVEAGSAAKTIIKIRSQMFEAAEKARLLQTMDEPAGDVLLPYVDGMWKPVGTKGRAVGGTRAGNKTATRALQTLAKGKAKRDKLMAKTVPMVKQGNGAEAYPMLYADMLDVTINRSFHGHQTTNPYSLEFMQHFYEARDAYMKAQRIKHMKAYQESMAQFAGRVQTYHEKLPSVVTAVLKPGENGLTTQQVFQGFDAVTKAWQGTNVWMTRYETCRQLLTRAGVSGFPDISISEQEHTNRSIAALASIITQSAEGVPTEEIKPLYLGLLSRLSDLEQRMLAPRTSSSESNLPVLAQCYDALSLLSQKDAPLAQQVQAYDVATNQFLQWKNRAATQMIKNFEEVTPNAPAVLGAGAPEEVTPRSPVFPTFPEKNAIRAQPFFKGMAHYQMQDTAMRLYEQPIAVSNLQSMPSSSIAVSQVSPSGSSALHYAMVDVPKWPESAVKLSSTYLLVTDEHPALTQQATQAIDSLKSSTRLAVGGRVNGITMETIVARLGSMTPAVSVLLPLNQPQSAAESLLSQDTQRPIESSLLWRINVAPVWMATPYEVTKL